MQRRNSAWLWTLARLGALLGAVALPSAAGGAEAPAELALSLEDALVRAERNAPELVRSRNELRNIEARRPGAAVLFPANPTVSLLIGLRREAQPDGTALRGIQHQLHIEQAIEVAGQRWARLDAVAAAVASQRDAVDYARVLARALVKALYVECVLVEQRLGVAQRREEFARHLLKSAETRVQLGAANAIEVNLARIEVGRVVGERADIAAERESRLVELRIATGLPSEVSLRLTTNIGPAVPGIAAELDVNQQIERALLLRSDLRAVRSQRNQLAAEARRLRREVVPNPILAFDYQQDLAGQVFFGGTIGLALPLWNRNQGPLFQVRAAERNRQAEEALLLTRIRAEVAGALATLRLRQAQVQAFAADALPPAEENVELLRRGWQAGKFDLFRVITALREMTEVKTRYLTMLEQLWLAGIALERASGTEVLAPPSGAL